MDWPTEMLKNISLTNMHRTPCLYMILILATLPARSSDAADWPMWRFDSGRTGASDGRLPKELTLRWVRQLPPNPPAFRDKRLQFDRGYEPIVLGRRMFVASAFDNSVIAYDTDDGGQLWKFFAEGPVRFAPVGGKGRILFGADDGHLYCLKASSGGIVWKFRAVPSNRRLLGNGRLISVWPVRGGPVLKDGRVYFAAGVWPLEGVFVYCLDAATGDVVWLNDRTSYLYGQQPHNTEGFGGLAPQGYLLIDGTDLVVPCSAAYPARFDLATGKLKSFELPKAGRLPGGWFASTPSERERQRLKRRGLLFDKGVTRVRHEDKPRDAGLPGIRTTIRVADREFQFTSGFPGVEGEVHTMLAAGGKLFVVTVEGHIYCFGKRSGQVHRHPIPKSVATRKSQRATDVLETIDVQHGYAVALGLDDPHFLAALVANSDLKVVGIDADPKVVASIRETLQLPAERLSLRVGDPRSYELPKYFASLIVVRDAPDNESLGRLYDSLRPYGGRLVVPASTMKVAKSSQRPGAKIEAGPRDWGATITRAGALKGATNYLADWNTNADLRVKAPVGVLWFGDSVSHFKRSPQPAFIDGVMVSVDKDWLDASNRKGGQDYRLLQPVLSDVYTGRVFNTSESADIRRQVAEIARKTIVDQTTVQPSQYRPPGARAAKGDAASVGKRLNPLTGEEEPRSFPKRYGCDGGLDYGALFTMRSATAAFYDKRTESGTINISGPRSGCTNSVIPANGLLNIPYFYEGCSCSYPLPMALALVSMPEQFEQWASWGEVPYSKLDGKIQRLGLNLGAPGDRKTDDGTLWLNYPDVGGPSPKLSITTEPKTPEYFYHHSVFMKDGDGWPWVTASGVRGLRKLTINGIRPGRYSVRLFFIATRDGAASFDVSVNGQRQLKAFDVAKRAGGTMRGVKHVVKSVGIDGSLWIELTPVSGQTVLSGIEVVAAPK